MKLCYYHDNEGNFGDDLNAWLWPRLLPGIITGTCKHGEEYYEENNREPALLYGIGTILDHRIPPAPVKFIAGSGIGYFSPPNFDETYKVYFVRGPKTAEKLGIDASFAMTDPAVLLKELLPPQESKYKTSLIMHCDTAKSGYWKQIAEHIGIHYIDPRNSDPTSVINELISSEYVITESLHGAIVADTFGIPWLPINTMPHINAFKWHDWCESVNLTYEPEHLITIYPATDAGLMKTLVNKGKALLGRKQLNRILKERRSYLSNRNIINNHIHNMMGKLEQLKIDAETLTKLPQKNP